MKKIVTLFITASAFATHAIGQASACPDVTTSDTAICGTAPCVNLVADVQGTNNTATYNISAIPYSPYAFTGGNQILIAIDDIWSNVIPLPFCFDYFGVTYNNIVIGSNAIVTFDQAQANQYCQWPIGNANPSNANPMNSIMAPWHDIDPSIGVTPNVNWQVYGTAPCRQFVVNWADVPMFQCNSMMATSQLVLHETTNIIDVYIRDKPICTTWNGGAAILGIVDPTAAVGYTVAGYNYPTQWAATNEGWRFEPSGAPNWTFAWYDMSGNQLSTSTTYQVCPPVTTSYVAVVTNNSCAGTIIVSDTATVSISPGNITATTTTQPEQCGNCQGSASTTANSGTAPFTYLWSPGGQTTASISGLCAGTYVVVITDAGGCSYNDTVTVANTSPPINPIIVTNASGGQLSQIGTGAPVDLCFNTSSPANITNWQWVFNGTQNSSTQNPCFTVTDTGNFCVVLAVTDTFGCTDTATACILVTSEAIFSFPNVFTPGADGHNDAFLPTTIGVKTINVEVYDRWGAHIYGWVADDPLINTTGWNGKTTKGKECSDGVYYWVATVTDFQMQSQNVSGFVHLIREK